jgi:DNA polymerase III subunit gamma/tau
MATLYRQYRPQTFAQVMGQPHITQTLQAAILKNQIAHAYLFQGPRGTGKTSTARIFAKRLQCLDAKGAEACGKCGPCVATSNNKNIDIVEIDAASNRGIDNIRSLREGTALSPAMSKYKVYIIDEVHMLSHDAFPALLKTLEEPVPHVIFILATTELHKVPQTIMSRCQVYRFRRATPADMRERLQYILKAEKRTAEDAVVDFIISRSDGCYRDAESLLGQLLHVDGKNITAEALIESLGVPSPKIITNFLAALAAQDLSGALEIADSIHAQGFDPEQFIQESIRTARDLLVLAATKQGDVPEFMNTPSASRNLTAAIRALVQATVDLAYVPQPMIALELAILTVCGSQPMAKSSFVPAKAATVPVVSSGLNVTTTVSSEPSIVSVEQVRGVWGELVNKMKQGNPVASTFLRAVEPTSVQGSNVILKVSYPLHQTFFEKPEQKAAVEKNLSDLVGKSVTIRAQMDANLLKKPVATSRVSTASSASDDSLYQNVKEVFGAGS